MTPQAFDILVDSELEDDDVDQLPAGWAGAQGPGIDVRAWPRSPRTGQPMVHCFTLVLPEAYRRRGPELVAVAVFQWSDDLYFQEPLSEVTAAIAGQPADTGDSGHPFWAELARSVLHPQLQIADDGVERLFAMIWLTEAELNAPKLERPACAPAFADHERQQAAIMKRYGLFGSVLLLPRVDPNAGVPPQGFPEDGDVYVEVPDKYDTFYMEHLGGTAMSPDGIRDGVSPWYIEVSRLGGLSHGGDQDLALDLDARDFLGNLSSGEPIHGPGTR